MVQFEAAPLVSGRDLDWNDAIAQAKPVDCVPVCATDPVYILYTSGTTGTPKVSSQDTVDLDHNNIGCNETSAVAKRFSGTVFFFSKQLY